MRGGFKHELYAGLLSTQYQRGGATVYEEYQVSVDGKQCFVDLVVVWAMVTWFVEVEMTASSRCWNDLQKARAGNADLLVVCAPTRSVVRAITRRLRDSPGLSAVAYRVLTIRECLGLRPSESC